MKFIIFILSAGLTAFSCSQPLPITTTPNEHTTTSGTMGSIKATESLPDKAQDSTAIRDTIKL